MTDNNFIIIKNNYLKRQETKHQKLKLYYTRVSVNMGNRFVSRQDVHRQIDGSVSTEIKTVVNDLIWLDQTALTTENPRYYVKPKSFRFTAVACVYSFQSV